MSKFMLNYLFHFINYASNYAICNMYFYGMHIADAVGYYVLLYDHVPRLSYRMLDQGNTTTLFKLIASIWHMPESYMHYYLFPMP